MRHIALLLFHSMLLAPGMLLAEEGAERWTVEPTEADLAPLASGQVLKWCEPNGKKVQYSTRVVPGYRLCGDLTASRSCDPSGRRFITPPGAKERPYAYKDCGVGRRIYVKRHDDPIVLAPPPDDGLKPKIEKPEITVEERQKSLLDFKDYSAQDPAVSEKEKDEFRKKMRERDEKEKAQIATDIDQVFQAVSEAMKKATGR